MIPLILRIKKLSHKEIAKAQDLIVEELYSRFNDAVLHGGTAIWRCYKGNRFSEDVDVYIPKQLDRIESLFSNFKKRGFAIEKNKIGDNSIFSNLNFNGTIVRFEALFKKAEGFLKEYETSEGNFITVYTLTAEQLIREKVSAYLKRSKIRDLYDIFFLLRYVKDKSKVNNDLKKLFSEFKEPTDKGDLKVLIFEGLVPTVDKMLEYIRGYA